MSKNANDYDCLLNMAKCKLISSQKVQRSVLEISIAFCTAVAVVNTGVTLIYMVKKVVYVMHVKRWHLLEAWAPIYKFHMAAIFQRCGDITKRTLQKKKINSHLLKKSLFAFAFDDHLIYWSKHFDSRNT